MVVILSLKNILKNNEKMRKIFGKKEIEIILKQVEGLKLTQSERNRLSRDIRPKFEAIQELNEFKDEFELEQNQDNKRIIEKAKEMILDSELKDKIQAIFLFGSFADKTYTKRSDIDICVLFKKDISLKEATRFRINVSGELPDKADIQVFNILPLKVKRDIARNHKVLYKTEGYDNTDFSIKYLKDDDYLIRMKKIFGNES
jgi:predicted nucleotidyltransferase